MMDKAPYALCDYACICGSLVEFKAADGVHLVSNSDQMHMCSLDMVAFYRHDFSVSVCALTQSAAKSITRPIKCPVGYLFFFMQKKCGKTQWEKQKILAAKSEIPCKTVDQCRTVSLQGALLSPGCYPGSGGWIDHFAGEACITTKSFD